MTELINNTYKKTKHCILNDSKLIWEIYKETENKIYLKSGNKKIITDTNNIRLLDETEISSIQKVTTNSVNHNISTVKDNVDIPNEIMLRHKTKLDALQDLDKFIDTAVLCKLPYVKIIHGKSGGIIRSAVHEYLNFSPYIESYHYGEYHQGGFGVTIAKLK